jgi:hypothetical protein
MALTQAVVNFDMSDLMAFGMSLCLYDFEYNNNLTNILRSRKMMSFVVDALVWPGIVAKVVLTCLRKSSVRLASRFASVPTIEDKL